MVEKNEIKSPQSIYKHIDRLFLDPNNYRLIDRPDYKRAPENKISDPDVQKRTRFLLLGKNNENVKDLIASFKENGYLPVDQIQVRKITGDNFLVLEGNRRIATLKYLYEEWKETGLDIGKLKESNFKYVPLILHPEETDKMHLIVMGLKHISGNKKWNTVNQAQYIEDLFTREKMSEEEICDSLGITKHLFRRARRTLALINLYKESDYGDQFESPMYSLFEEVIRSINLKEWLQWNDEHFRPDNKVNMQRFFSWISKDEVPDENVNDAKEEDEEKRNERTLVLEPIITKSQELRELAKFIKDENALKRMEESRSVTEGYTFSDALGENKFNNAVEQINKNVGTLFNFLEYMKDEDFEQIENLRDKMDRIIPTIRARIVRASVSSLVVPGIVSEHFSEINIGHFRRHQNVKLKKLNRVNIFAGYNNSGKTSVLEAVYLLTKLNDINAFFEMERYRGKFVDELNSKWLENNFLKPIELEGTFNGKDIKISIVKENTEEEIDKSGYLTTFELISEHDHKESTSKAHLYSHKGSKIFYEDKSILCDSIMTSPYRENGSDLKNAHAKAVENKSIDVVIDFIRQNIDPAIRKIEMTTIDGVSRFYVTSDEFEKSVDITSFGEGVQRIFEIALFFAYAQNGVLLIDEFETAIHKSLLNNFSKFVQELAETFNVQVFLTSHSKECIDSFITNDYKIEDITAYVLKEEDGKIVCKYVEGKRLQTLLNSFNVDIREG